MEPRFRVARLARNFAQTFLPWMLKDTELRALVSFAFSVASSRNLQYGSLAVLKVLWWVPRCLPVLRCHALLHSQMPWVCYTHVAWRPLGEAAL